MHGLARRWTAGFQAPVDPTAAAAAGRELLTRWAEPHRRYHTLEHLLAVLTIVDDNVAVARDPVAVRLAAWYHDASYDPRAADNEERSAELARRELTRLDQPAGLIEEVVRLVRLTASHDPEPGDRDGALLTDADLAILAADETTYDRYAQAIREEYAHVPPDVFRAGRTAVLRRLSEAPTLYRVVPERAAWTDRARANLHRELAALGWAAS